MAIGKVWLVGAGPGDPGLITVRGRRVLETSEVVLHDALSHPGLLDFCKQAEIVNVGKRYGERSPPQELITNQLIQYARTLLKRQVLFGSDYPMITPDRWLADFEQLGFDAETAQLILKDNAARLLRLG